MNVLVVDDQERVLKATKLLVHWNQIGVDRVFTASSAEMARQVFARETVDILLTDIEMPGEDGLALHRWQMEHSPDTACIFLTSHADFSYAQEAIRNGAYGYILQPAEIPEQDAALVRLNDLKRMPRADVKRVLTTANGSGYLRMVIRQYLRTVPGVASFHDEHVQLGGAGITIVEFQ